MDHSSFAEFSHAVGMDGQSGGLGERIPRAPPKSSLAADVKSEYCHTILNRVRAGNWAKFACEFNADRKQTCRRSRGMQTLGR